MPLVSRGIRYYSFGSFSGYGQAAVAYVRALVNAGIPVQWIPLDWTTERMVASSWTLPNGSRQPLIDKCGTRGNLADMLALLGCTTTPVDHDTVIVHAPPESWPALFERGKHNVGMTVWETDRAPAHWLPLLRGANCVIVPCELNRAVFARDGLDLPIRVVPHIRRHCWCEYAPSAVSAARAQLGLHEADRVFYTINTWDPRKAIPDMIAAFARAFPADADAVLLIHTGAFGHDSEPLYEYRSTRELAAQALQTAALETGRPLPRIVLHNAELDGDAIDLIHALGDVYVSLSRGEGWSLGAFEAATLGKPVVMTGWGGQCEFLGSAWPGAVPFRMQAAPLWPPGLPSIFPSQRWARPDLDAAARMLRNVMQNPELAFAAARAIRERIVRDYAEPVVVNTLIEAIA